MGASEIISLLGGIALFLFGMAIMGDGLKKVAGSKLELVLYKLTSTPLKGVLLGTGVTAVIQSSSATSVMVVGFVNSGMMKVNQAIGIVMGAILGTSVTGWILCLSSLSGGSGWVTLLSTATLTGLVAVVGIILRMAAKRPATHHVGDILLGFAVLMYGMSIMSDAVSPLRDSQVFIDALTSFSNPLLGILVGLLFSMYSPQMYYLVYAGIACFGLAAIFQLVTLPTEFNASRRALAAIESGHLLYDEEIQGARKTLRAAALTYVAALAVSLTQLLRLLLLFGGNGRRRND